MRIVPRAAVAACCIRVSGFRFAIAALLCVTLLLPACGYHIAGKADTLPETIRTIAIPTFANGTTEYKIEQYLTQAVAHEFIARTRYRVVDREEEADALLQGSVVNFFVFPVIYDPVSGRATTINILTQVQVSLWDRQTGKQLYVNPNFEARERYEVTTDPEAYLEERQAALVRSSQAAARSLVSAILEGF
jgi:hypothetical protein